MKAFLDNFFEENLFIRATLTEPQRIKFFTFRLDSALNSNIKG